MRRLDTDGRLPRAWFRRQIWNPALQTAGIGFPVRFRDLRHAHASWLLAGGADIQTVKERMGHANITTTQKYLHTRTNADRAAVTALDTIRNRARYGNLQPCLAGEQGTGTACDTVESVDDVALE